jgi:hypothetical protein
VQQTYQVVLILLAPVHVAPFKDFVEQQIYWDKVKHFIGNVFNFKVTQHLYRTYKKAKKHIIFSTAKLQSANNNFIVKLIL